MYTLPSRLLPAARAVFDALNGQHIPGIIFGGAAAAMIGSDRRTKDIDINVAAFPQIPSTDSVLARMGSHDMMRVTHLHPTDAIKCDVANRRAGHMPLFLRHAIHDKENGITCAGPALLLADKIHTFAHRGVAKQKKGESDLEDISFCIQKMYLETGEKMPNELRFLYTAGGLGTGLRSIGGG